MAKKTEIQYVGQFYVYGSEARELAPQPKKWKARLPEIRLERLQKIYIDPLALAGLAVAACMLVVLIMGAFHMRDTRAEYDRVNTVLSDLKRENAALSHTYHTSYDLAEIRQIAEGMGMIDAEEAERFTVVFSVPEPRQERSAWDDLVWFFSQLLSDPKRGS